MGQRNHLLYHRLCHNYRGLLYQGSTAQWNLDIMRGQGTGKICSLLRGVIMLRFFFKYSRTSRKRSPKMQRLSGRLRGGGRLQESNQKGSLPTRGPGKSTLWRIIIYCMQRLSSYMCSSLLSLKFFVYPE